MNDEMHDLAPAFALGSLDPDDRRSFEAHLLGCDECRTTVAAMKEASAELAWSVATEVPEHLRTRVLSAVESSPQEERPTTLVTELAPRRRRRWLPASIAAALVVIALLGWSLLGSGRLLNDILDDPAGVTTVVTATEIGQTAFDDARIVYSPDHAATVLVIDGLADLPGDRTYELWLIDEGGPRPAGLFVPDDDGHTTVLVEGVAAPGLVVALTEEPAGGVESPTGEVLFTAEVGA